MSPRQLQNIIKRIADRRHNERAFEYHLQRHEITGTKLDYINNKTVAMLDEMERVQEHKKEKMVKIQEDLKNLARK